MAGIISNYKRRFITLCMVMFLVMALWYNLTQNKFRPSPEPVPLGLHTTDNQTTTFFERQVNIQQTRVQNIREVCSANSYLKKSKYQNSKYLFSSVYNFAICLVLKSGSTFLRQALSILDQGEGVADKVFSAARFKIHASSVASVKKVKLNNLSAVPSIVVSRDPFTRLFSAYVDKLYLPLMFSLRSTIKGQSKVKSRCPAEISFQEFLDFIVSTYMAGKDLNNHWAPIHPRCAPCNGKVVALVKQESFSTDVAYIMEAFNVEAKKQEKILEALHSKRIDYNIGAIVKTVLEKPKQATALDCIGRKGCVERLWTSFQIQGYLLDTVPFPDNLAETSWKNTTFVIELILKEIKAHPMSVDAQKDQRISSLIKAYRGVKRETLSQIRQIYQADFDLFGYKPEPPM